jgi:hypothetical protein
LGGQERRQCRVPTGKASYCVSHTECPYVLDLIKSLKEDRPSNVNLIIRLDIYYFKKEFVVDVQNKPPHKFASYLKKSKPV